MTKIKIKLGNVGISSAPQFERTSYSVHLQGKVSPEEFQETLGQCNAIMNEHGVGCWNIGCILFPLCCCLCVAGCQNQSAMKHVANFLEEENRRLYLARGVQWSVRTKTHYDRDSDGHEHAHTKTWIQIDVTHTTQQVVVIQQTTTAAPAGGMPYHYPPQQQGYPAYQPTGDYSAAYNQNPTAPLLHNAQHYS
jgi:hypothetical protein